MKYAIQPVLKNISEWMEYNNFEDMDLEEFMHLAEDCHHVANDCMEFIHELYHANKG